MENLAKLILSDHAPRMDAVPVHPTDGCWRLWQPPWTPHWTAIMIDGVSEMGSSTWESGYMTLGLPESQIEFIENGRNQTIVSVDHCFLESKSKRKATRDRFQ